MNYESPYSTRYGSAEMRSLWSERTKRLAWRKIWTAVAEVQAAAGLVTAEQIDTIKENQDKVNIERAQEIEEEIGHDLMAELKAYAEQCGQGGSVLHWGLTSADVQDNADIVRQKAGLTLLLTKLRRSLLLIADHIAAWADLPVMGYTHLQPAEPTTLGYRLAGYAQELLLHFEQLARLRLQLRGKGIKGAVGSAAAFQEMLSNTAVTPEMLEASVMEALGIEAFPISTQTYPRVQDYWLLSSLSGLAASLHKMAFDLRVLQSPGFRTLAEPFGAKQVGSSAMPFKRNPVKAEKICSLTRQIASHLQTTWENSALSLLERTLDDSANRRSVIPEAFLAMDEVLITLNKILENLAVDQQAIKRTLTNFGPFSALERVLNELVRAGADRQQMHERLREHSMVAWEAVENASANPLVDHLSADTTILKYLQPVRIRELLNADSYVGTAPQRALEMAAVIKKRFPPTEQNP
ncbi:MAG: adenylosuccinate lyase [Anaerolineales bacterium]|nr:adenylosuccinate lyase [Anaerolineales bacterium]